MESIIILTGLGLGGALALPMLVEWLQKFRIPLVLATMVIVSLQTAAPYSPEARFLLGGLHKVPQLFTDAFTYGDDGLAKISSEYFNAFHG